MVGPQGSFQTRPVPCVTSTPEGERGDKMALIAEEANERETKQRVGKGTGMTQGCRHMALFPHISHNTPPNPESLGGEGGLHCAVQAQSRILIDNLISGRSHGKCCRVRR